MVNRSSSVIPSLSVGFIRSSSLLAGYRQAHFSAVLYLSTSEISTRLVSPSTSPVLALSKHWTKTSHVPLMYASASSGRLAIASLSSFIVMLLVSFCLVYSCVPCGSLVTAHRLFSCGCGHVSGLKKIIF